MDIEQLTLILDAARAAGDGAMSVVLIWFAFKFVGLMLSTSLIGGGMYAVYRVLTGVLQNITFTSKVQGLIGSFEADSPIQVRNVLRWMEEQAEKSPPPKYWWKGD